MPTPCYIVDIDGTIADLTHRLPHIQKEPKDWDAFFAACDRDGPIPHMIDMLNALGGGNEAFMFVTGRPERCRAPTFKWLRRMFPNWTWDSEDGSRDLYMRADGDHRPDEIVKAELLDRMLVDGARPIMAFEDRTRVVKMWRSRGIPCLQVADGDF